MAGRAVLKKLSIRVGADTARAYLYGNSNIKVEYSVNNYTGEILETNLKNALQMEKKLLKDFASAGRTTEGFKILAELGGIKGGIADLRSKENAEKMFRIKQTPEYKQKQKAQEAKKKQKESDFRASQKRKKEKYKTT